MFNTSVEMKFDKVVYRPNIIYIYIYNQLIESYEYIEFSNFSFLFLIVTVANYRLRSHLYKPNNWIYKAQQFLKLIVFERVRFTGLLTIVIAVLFT